MRHFFLMIAAAGLFCASLPAQAPVAKQPQPKSQKEVEALQAIFSAAEPAARIEAVERLLTNFADTEFKASALQIAAASAQEMNDFDKMIIYCERTMEADPKNFSALLMMASGLAQRTREFDLDREEKLGRVEKYAKEAVQLLQAAPKPRPDITDEQWEGAKKDFTAQAHEALGMAAMVRKKYDVAVTEFKTAVETAANQDPATKVRLGAAYNNAGKYDEAVAILDNVLGDAELHPAIRQFAQGEKMRALKAKEAKK